MSQNTIYGNQVQWRALSTNLDCQRRPLFHTLPKEGSQLASVCELWSKLAPTLFGGSFLSFSCSSGKSEMSLYSHYRQIFLTGFIQVYVDMLFLIPHTNSSNSSFMIVALVFKKMLLINDSDATKAWHCYMSFDDSIVLTMFEELVEWWANLWLCSSSGGPFYRIILEPRRDSTYSTHRLKCFIKQTK